MQRIGALAFLAIALAACATVGFVGAMRPTGTVAFLAFSAWLLSPYVAAVLLPLASYSARHTHKRQP